MIFCSIITKPKTKKNKKKKRKEDQIKKTQRIEKKKESKILKSKILKSNFQLRSIILQLSFVGLKNCENRRGLSGPRNGRSYGMPVTSAIA